MSTDLPASARRFIEAANRDDAVAVGDTFAADATVFDEQREIAGREAIKAWFQDSSAAVKARIRLVGVSLAVNGGVAHAEVSGAFPGSPVRLNFHFTAGETAISRLEIKP